MTPADTRMAAEAAEAPERTAALLAANAAACAALARRPGGRPRLIVTCARGSSDHAATYLQYLAQLQLGVPAMSLPPSIASVYRAGIDLSGALFVVVSQSGRSPDLVLGAEWAKEHGAEVVALVNVEDSPVAAAAHHLLPLHAGPETSVAATKSFLAALTAGAQMLAAFGGDAGFARAVAEIPQALERARGCDWSAALEPLGAARNAYVAGRGYGLAAAAEMALKLKETSARHAEAYSSAEIQHGPLGLLREGMPILVIGQDDPTLASTRELAETLAAKGAHVLSAFEAPGHGVSLPVVPGLHPAIAPLAAVQSFYRLASDLAVAQGRDPDRPPHLSKVTETR